MHLTALILPKYLLKIFITIAVLDCGINSTKAFILALHLEENKK
jgi:hypothetical protein